VTDWAFSTTRPNNRKRSQRRGVRPDAALWRRGFHVGAFRRRASKCLRVAPLLHHEPDRLQPTGGGHVRPLASRRRQRQLLPHALLVEQPRLGLQPLTRAPAPEESRNFSDSELDKTAQSAISKPFLGWIDKDLQSDVLLQYLLNLTKRILTIRCQCDYLDGKRPYFYTISFILYHTCASKSLFLILLISYLKICQLFTCLRASQS